MEIESKEITTCKHCEKDLEKISKQKQQIVQETGCKAAVRTNTHNKIKKEGLTMTFNDAQKLHNEDEVIIKETGEHLYVLDAYVNPDNPQQILIECDDGNTYTHHEIN